MSDATIWKVLFFVIWPYIVVLLVYLHDWIRKRMRRKVAEEESNASGFDMFCDEHFIEALDYITDRFPEHSVGFCEAIRDEEFDDDESMRCGYPECDKESTHEIHWIKFEEARGFKKGFIHGFTHGKKEDKKE